MPETKEKIPKGAQDFSAEGKGGKGEDLESITAAAPETAEDINKEDTEVSPEDVDNAKQILEQELDVDVSGSPSEATEQVSAALKDSDKVADVVKRKKWAKVATAVKTLILTSLILIGYGALERGAQAGEVSKDKQEQVDDKSKEQEASVIKNWLSKPLGERQEAPDDSVFQFITYLERIIEKNPQKYSITWEHMTRKNSRTGTTESIKTPVLWVGEGGKKNGIYLTPKEGGLVQHVVEIAQSGK